MYKTVVLNVVGLTAGLMEAHAPFLRRWAAGGTCVPVTSVLPAVTCSVQATYLTGVYPDSHGIVGNGWYFKDTCEVRFWHQSNKLVQGAKLWDEARRRDPSFTCANLFWWYNMYAATDVSVTPRPMYPADGRKLPDIYTQPAGLRPDLQQELGPFPLFEFWGPNASIRSSRWIADAARAVETRSPSTLTLVYLPHLDYVLQQEGPAGPSVAARVAEIDAVCEELIGFFEARDARVVVLSEYGIHAVHHPIHINRLLREHGLIAVREELGRELLDPGASAAFAVADHQIAHVYVNDPDRLGEVRTLLANVSGIDLVLDAEGKRAHHLDHPRAGTLVAVAAPDAWFTYYYWLDDDRAPDYARTVEIHRKPGYDPVELFVDPALRFPKARVANRLLRKTLGFRYLMDVISLDATLVKGSHGRLSTDPDEGPLLITRHADLLAGPTLLPTDVYDVLLAHLTGTPPVPD
jgi:predicted AlkP superfamily pyrophosphatase or phosphodiesterase